MKLVPLSRFCTYKQHSNLEKEETSSHKRQRKLIVVGLGNPGQKYESTRHNVGFLACDRFLEHMRSEGVEVEPFEAESGSKYAEAHFAMDFANYRTLDLCDQTSARRRARTVSHGVPFPLVSFAILKPLTFMNRSGSALRSFFDKCKIDTKKLKRPTSSNFMPELLVIYDDLSLPFGKMRLSPKGGSGGHNGMNSIISSVGTERFARLRVGIAAPHLASSGTRDFVLQNFKSEEIDQLPRLLADIASIIRLYAHRGFESASNVANNYSAS